MAALVDIITWGTQPGPHDASKMAALDDVIAWRTQLGPLNTSKMADVDDVITWVTQLGPFHTPKMVALGPAPSSPAPLPSPAPPGPLLTLPLAGIERRRQGGVMHPAGVAPPLLALLQLQHAQGREGPLANHGGGGGAGLDVGWPHPLHHQVAGGEVGHVTQEEAPGPAHPGQGGRRGFLGAGWGERDQYGPV